MTEKTKSDLKKMYIVNEKGYYFCIYKAESGEPIVDLAELKDCSAHKSDNEMYRRACEITGLSMEEVSGNEICIRKDGDAYLETDCRGMWFEIDLKDGQTLESFISNYVT